MSLSRTSAVGPLSLILLAAVVACGGDAPEEMPEAEAPAAAPAPAPMMVSITEPVDGAVVDGPNVTVRLAAQGVEIRPAGEVLEGTGHHHILLDADLNEPGTPVPTVPGSVIHLGDGSAEYTFEGVAAGEHRLITVVADGIHVPLQPWVVDTVTFTVR